MPWGTRDKTRRQVLTHDGRVYTRWSTNRCFFCHRELTDDESVRKGYGPTCAENQGMDWGDGVIVEYEWKEMENDGSDESSEPGGSVGISDSGSQGGDTVHRGPTRKYRRRRNAQGEVRGDVPDPRDPILGVGGSPPLPDQFERFRPHQWEAIETILGHYADGKKVVFLDAPTGAGKTLIAEAVRRRLMHERQKGQVDSFSEIQAIYCCNNKSLQDQFCADYPYGELLKGRSNYPTLNHPDDFPEVSAADCNKRRDSNEQEVCDECHTPSRCFYTMARNLAEMAPLAVLNTAYFLTITNYTNRFQDRGLVILDEADELEGELMRFVEVTITRGLRNWLAIDLPEQVGDMEAWGEWLTDVGRKVYAKAKVLSPRNRKDRRRRKGLMELVDKIGVIIPQLNDDWVVDGYEDARRRRGTVDRESVRFRPVHVRDQGQEYLWKHGERFLLMSATIISPAQMAQDLGLEDGEWASVYVDSTFPPERRPVFLDRHVGPVVRKNEAEALPKLVAEVESVAGEFATERILCHTHSYRLSKHLEDNLSLNGRKVLSYTDSRSREGILGRWLETDNGILLAPSFDRGIDLKEDLCRVQLICKAPFPYLGDKQVGKRMRTPGGQVWYTIETVRSIVQATGRVMRSEDDWGATIILDGSVWRLLREDGQLFPRWWREAVVKGLDAQSQEIREGFAAVRDP